MRKNQVISRLSLLLLLCLLLSACGREAAAATQNVLPSGPASSAAAPAGTVPPAETAPPYDLDLLACSATVVYAEVFNMMNTPEDYLGKRVRMEGVLASYSYPDHTVYGCIIADATACCKQGMEFVLADDRPERYPPPGSEIVVSGRFNTYQAGEFTFCNLVDCQLEAVRSVPDAAAP